jgi:hypothetical protein
VLAVVAQEIVAAFAQPRTSASEDALRAQAVGDAANVNGTFPNEILECSLLDTAVRISKAPSVMNDASLARVDAVVSISASVNDEASSSHEFML